MKTENQQYKYKTKGLRMIYFIIIYTFKKQNKNFLFNRKVLNSCEEICINHRTLILQHLIIFDSNNSHFFKNFFYKIKKLY